MGSIDGKLLTAARYEAAVRRQDAVSDPEGEAIMLNRRSDFMVASERVFFESIIEGSDLLPIRYLAMGQMAARAVGRIHLPAADGRGSGFATGFLIAPGLLMTNQHVLPSAAAARVASLTMDAEDGEQGLPMAPRVFQLDPDRAFVADFNLDFTIVGVRQRATDGTPLAAFGYLRLHDATGKVVRGEYASIIQHPNGRQKHIAARNNKILVYVYDHDLPPEERSSNSFLYYATDTLKGSSGSPVMSDQWYVVALHRRGVPKTRTVRGKKVIVRRNNRVAAKDDPDEVIAYESNEGVRISHIFARLRTLAVDEAEAIRRPAQNVLAAIQEAAGSISDGPFQNRSQGYTSLKDLSRSARTPPDCTLEVLRRRAVSFPEDRGYDPNFLGNFAIPLPTPEHALQLELAPRTDQVGKVFWLPFRHFSTLVHARRRMPVMAAVNIAGAKKPSGGMPNRPRWSYDPRIAEEHQPDDSIFSSLVQRGHLAAREYVYWGDSDEVNEADIHSFTLTNACPQIDAFNGRNGEWFQVERLVMAGSKAEGLRVTEFCGPIFRADDPEYDSLRGPGSTAEFGTTIRIPLRFWKIVVWVENGELKHQALLLDQRQELEDAGPLEFDIQAPTGVQKTTVKRISQLVGLSFEGI